MNVRTEVTDRPIVPPRAPVEMPVQDFSNRPEAGIARAHDSWRVWAARLIAFGGTAAIAVLGCLQMLAAFRNDPTPMQFALLVLFVPTFAWVGFSFCGTFAGFLAPQLKTPEGPNDARVAVIMPIYHEDVAVSTGLLVALARELEAEGMADRTEIFVLSDTRDPAVAVNETLVIDEARRLSPLPLWYRRRLTNEDRKSGNVAEFVREWGGRYDQMVVLDADSVMSGATIRELSARMNADPRMGLIQTMPMLVGGETIFARLMQFAGRVYGPMIARGVAAWSGNTGNYWGHNAIIRIPAFAQACGLPRLPGKPPFGGTILSHDFVEAAALCRAGWSVRLDHDLRGSYEGCPPTLLDMAARERRWAQGNLQHSRLLGVKGLRGISRAHFTIGIMGFLMSPIWLALILVGLILSATVLLSTPEYFPSAYQLFPNWPVFDARRMLWLFFAAMALLLLPKFIATFRAWARPLALQSGGRVRIFASAIFETVLSALIAPVQMLVQTRQIIEILQGRDSGWNAQVRAGSMPGWGVVLGYHWWHVLLGLGTLIVLSIFSPAQLIWLSPIVAGLILSPLTSRLSASPVFGRWARMRGLLVTPEERDPPKILTEAAAITRNLSRILPGADSIRSIGRDPELLARHKAGLAPLPDDLPTQWHLARITAEAKIANADSRTQALSWLDRAETDALVSDPGLLSRWSELPE
ncbi:glucans biosynthesis glucosyltransferase MdoH [Paracoccus sp. 1_MG-2023]|uniref:glucans biosynthesis glucosyltransferase MdoH n=1 Tax=unclassified Paracoccus (in: a-proteobacteria) TaxID=2688777 RepID=UPI001C0973C7|nr:MULTISPECIES: glucans biosynthesis glucosyltransferase MdoH [unclassified Paracoccus (in: a-proteobacteria)]MBU2959219.1 glucans biosynthesis glucosyltransferase MdoH [Paracoccus sp. C2R09]MDO6670329.1 glucans biosynthesis glucosyltransferase MdoH [Paracoccus sp. 1_MG-2023]